MSQPKTLPTRGYRVCVEFDVQADDQAGVLVELYRRFGEQDGWALREMWTATGGHVDGIAAEQQWWPEASRRVRQEGLLARCQRPGCTHPLRHDGVPLCLMPPRRLLAIAHDTLGGLVATFKARRKKR